MYLVKLMMRAQREHFHVLLQHSIHLIRHILSLVQRSLGAVLSTRDSLKSEHPGSELLNGLPAGHQTLSFPKNSHKFGNI